MRSFARHRYALSAVAVAVSLLFFSAEGRAQVPGGTLDPTTIPKYVTPLVVPPAMPRTATIHEPGVGVVDYYEIAVQQFQQQILPMGSPATTVWSYGAVGQPETLHYPAFTIEARWRRPVRVRWVNGLVAADGGYLPHLLPVDQTLHWANPPMACIDGRPRTECRGGDAARYEGPVPIVTHVHGAHVGPESDGYPEAWWLPDAVDIPAGYATEGARFDQYDWGMDEAGSAVFQYPNDQDATTLWYHDHALGITRLNVYAGPAGFYLLRGGPRDMPGSRLPGPAPGHGDPPGTAYYEIPIVVQDRSFNADGSLFYPDHRAFFEGLDVAQLLVPFIGEEPAEFVSDVSKIWNPEFFGNTMVVNGKTWPYLDVERRRYRFRFLNGCNSRFLILAMAGNAGAPTFWQIGGDGGFLPAPLERDTLLLGPAERGDVIVDFSALPVGAEVVLLNIGPDEPYGGGAPGVEFDVADPSTTGQVMLFRVVESAGRPVDPSRPPASLRLPRRAPLGPAASVRRVSLNELESETVTVSETAAGDVVFDPHSAEPFAPIAAVLGTVDGAGLGAPLAWGDAVSENPAVDTTEVWEIHNFTEDAHPIHLHLVMFEVVDRAPLDAPMVARPAEAWETGLKDTVIAYPGEITRVKAYFDVAGLYVWHCHILEHEDNEMMRPYCVGDLAADCDMPPAPAVAAPPPTAVSHARQSAPTTERFIQPLGPAAATTPEMEREAEPPWSSPGEWRPNSKPVPGRSPWSPPATALRSERERRLPR